MISLGKTSLAFLGPRTYLHSTEVFHLFCHLTEKLQPEERPIHIESFRFLRETQYNGEAFLLDNDDASSQAKPVASLVFRDARGLRRRFELTDSGNPIDRRDPEPPRYCSSPLLGDDFCGGFACHGINSHGDFWVALMEASKAVHMATLSRRNEDTARLYRFVSCEGLDLAGIAPPDGRLMLHFGPAKVRRAGDRVFTVTQVRSQSPSAPEVLRTFRLTIAY